MNLTRDKICQLTSKRFAAVIPDLRSIKATIGLDGFVDEIISVVNKRHDAQRYQPITSIDELARRISSAAGQSANYELVVHQMKLGGNGPIMADTMARLGVSVTYVGNLGYPNLHPVFQDFANRARIISIGEPAHTDALEFEDGKLMLGKLAPLNDVTWDNLIARVGFDCLKSIIADAHLIAMLNWTMLPHMSRIWAKLLDEIIPDSERHSRRLFIDLADPRKRTNDDIVDALRLLTRFQDQIDVILGLNLNESIEVADVLGLPGAAEPEDAIEENAVAIREKLNLACVVIHPRRSAAAAIEGSSARFDGPFVKQPKISTGAGDHFNAGFCLARVLGFTLEESLCLGSAASGFYVRTAKSPDAQELADFVANLPGPQ